MTQDAIKMIREALEDYTYVVEEFWETHTEDTIKATLRVLQRIASGDDWFPIESAPKDGSWFLCNSEIDGIKQVHNVKGTRVLPKPEGRTEEQNTYWMPRDIKGKGFDATHWKPLDQAKHIEMLMKEEKTNEPTR